ncbi:MAG: integrase core domain-containing protein [Bacteroidales bacterium]|nr:integrase core domain-containing protein [Bacteroidales bacterium]
MSLRLRSDHGTQYDSRDFMKEMEYLGLKMSKSFVRSPECNGCIERFNRTIEEEVFSIENFYSIEEAHVVIKRFIDNYNKDWIIHRLGCMSPIEYWRIFEKKAKAA